MMTFVFAEFWIDLPGTRAEEATQARKEPAHEVAGCGDAADVGEVAEEGPPDHGGPCEPVEDRLKLVIGDADPRVRQADFEAQPHKVVGWADALVGGEAETETLADGEVAVECLAT